MKATRKGQQPPAFGDYASVQKFLKEMTEAHFTEAERQARLAVLEEFCHFVARTPDEMIAEIFDVETHKYRKRGFYTARVKEFSEQVSGTWSEQVARGNVIRSFFIANGRRLPNEKPPWL